MVVKGIDMGAALLWLLRGKNAPGKTTLASQQHLPSYAVAGAAVGAGCARVLGYQSVMEASGRISSSTLPPCRAVRTWKTGHFYFALVSFSLFWRLGVAYGVQRIGFFWKSFVHLTWFDSGYMFPEGFGIIYIFSTLR